MLIVILWISIFIVISYEYWALNFHLSSSLLLKMQNFGWIEKNFLINPEPGRPLSLYLGWVGLSLMVCMNIYSIRKRISILKSLGQLRRWLDFHVLCGLIGPTLIVFHSNFKVRGLVAISFWSMVVSFSSGIIGRYIYLQLSGRKSDLELESEKILRKLDQNLEESQAKISKEERNKTLNMALSHAGVPQDFDSVGPFSVLRLTILGDLRLFFQPPFRPLRWPAQTQIILKSYAIATNSFNVTCINFSEQNFFFIS
jgi:hypothetical protein